MLHVSACVRRLDGVGILHEFKIEPGPEQLEVTIFLVTRIIQCCNAVPRQFC